MSRYYSKRNEHSCLYYMLFWPFILIGIMMKYLVLLTAYIIFVIFTLPATLIGEILKSNTIISANSGEEYEKMCCDLLKKKGFYSISTTPRTGDHGVDIIAFANGKKYAIQCKFYSSPVGNHAVQEIFSGCRYYNCDIPVVLTNSTFTENAIDEAEKIGVELWEKNAIPYRPRVSYKSFFKKKQDFAEEYQEEREYFEEDYIDVDFNEEVITNVRKFTDEEINLIIKKNNIELENLDSYFKDVAELFIERGKGSIGLVQRKYRIGFNRAARIVDQLKIFEVIDEIQETKPISVLMTMEDFTFLYKNLAEYQTDLTRPVKRKMSKAEIYQYAQECEEWIRKEEK